MGTFYPWTACFFCSCSHPASIKKTVWSQDCLKHCSHSALITVALFSYQSRTILPKNLPLVGLNLVGNVRYRPSTLLFLWFIKAYCLTDRYFSCSLSLSFLYAFRVNHITAPGKGMELRTLRLYIWLQQKMCLLGSKVANVFRSYSVLAYSICAKRPQVHFHSLSVDHCPSVHMARLHPHSIPVAKQQQGKQRTGRGDKARSCRDSLSNLPHRYHFIEVREQNPGESCQMWNTCCAQFWLWRTILCACLSMQALMVWSSHVQRRTQTFKQK